MIDVDKYLNELPDPSKDKMPPRVGILTDEEVRAIRRDKRKGARKNWGKDAEAMVKRILESPSCFSAKAVTKKDDRLQEVVGKDGKTRRFYANWKHPDFKFAALDTDGIYKTGFCEVKACSAVSNGISLYAQNTLGQIDYMNGLDQSKYILWWALVFWEGAGKARVFFMPHAEFMILRKRLQEKASGNFKGKSLRRKKDLDLLEGCEITKLGNRWGLLENHWYAG